MIENEDIAMELRYISNNRLNTGLYRRLGPSDWIHERR